MTDKHDWAGNCILLTFVVAAWITTFGILWTAGG